MNPSNITVAVVDRDPTDLALLVSMLEDAGYRVLEAGTHAHVARYAATEALNLVVAGYDSGHADPAAFMAEVRGHSPDTEFILCCRGATVPEAVEVLRAGARDFLPKPVPASALLAAVARALERQELVARDPNLRRSLKRRNAPDIFVGTSARMRTIADTVGEVATAEVPVLITGESGTGKELVARAIHDRSLRRSGPFVAINCAGLPDTLIESELFGHVRGAFTGAVNDRPGAFQLAGGGTLFLDEIGDLSLKGQGDLLRVLEDGFFRPVGSPRAVRADVRILAATNRVLSAWSNEGRFREDLLYRLNIVEVALPPLRERPEDIPALVESFNSHFAARHGRRRKRFSPAFIDALARHPWPGNIRQLRNLIERLVVTVRDADIGPGHAPAPPAARAPAADVLFEVRAGMTAAQVEERLIRETLARHPGARREAARALGIGLRTLAYRVKAYGLAGRGQG